MILFIDDEPRIMDSYREYLELKMKPLGYDVVFLSKVDEALSYFDEHCNEIDLIILDIMMPSGSQLDWKKTNGGLKTGAVFYELIRKQLPDLPIIIFTNYFDEDIEKKFSKDPKCRYLQKIDYLLDDFTNEVKTALALSSDQE